MKSIFLQPVNECKKCLVVRHTDGYPVLLYRNDDDTVFISEGTVYTHISRIDKIYETDLELPLLDEGDKFYIAEIKKEVTIKKRMRSSDGSITYEVQSRDEVVNSEYDLTQIKKELNIIYKEAEKYEKLLHEVQHRWNGKSILKAAGIEESEE